MKLISRTLNSSIFLLPNGRIHKCIEDPFEINGFPEFMMIQTINRLYDSTPATEKPNIVRYQPIFTGKSIMFETDFYPMSLDDYIDARKYDMTDLRRMIDQIGRAIAWMHHHDLLHRDIKPANILVDKNGNFFLGDFGSTKQGPCRTEDRTTKVMQAPELIDNPLGYTELTDIFAFGVCIFIMQHRRYPIKIDALKPLTSREYSTKLRNLDEYLRINDYMEPDPSARKRITKYKFTSTFNQPLSRNECVQILINANIAQSTAEYLTSIYFDWSDIIEKNMINISSSDLQKLMKCQF